MQKQAIGPVDETVLELVHIHEEQRCRLSVPAPLVECQVAFGEPLEHPAADFREDGLRHACKHKALDDAYRRRSLHSGLGRRFTRVSAVESGGGAVRDLRFNAERAKLTGVKAQQSTAEAVIEKLDRAPDFVLADPPRAGLGKAMVERLVTLKPRRLTIIACDPATLARDLAALTAAGYRIASMTLVDLFPQTFHLEIVVRLEIG